MNRYDVTNLKNGRKFSVIAETQVIHHAWGNEAGQKLKSACDAWEIANGSSAGVNDIGLELWQFPKSYSIVVTNIDADIAAEAAKKSARIARHARMKNLNPGAANSVAELRAIVKELVDEINDLLGN